MAEGTGGETCDSPIDSQGRESKTGGESQKRNARTVLRSLGPTLSANTHSVGSG